MLISSVDLLSKIKKSKALCAFNFSTFEVAEAIIQTAARLNTPVILQTSQGEAAFLDPKLARSTAAFLSEKYGILLSLNLDHGKDLKLIKDCIAVGYSSVQIDGSSLPFKDNIAITKKVVDLCRKKGISVEGEIGQINGELTRLEEAVRFIEETKVDFLAVAIGEKHGLGKPELRFDLLKSLVRLIKVPLVLHGGSGISKKELQKAVSLGVRKINFNTELRLVWTNALRKTLKEKPKEIVPYKILPVAQKAVAKVVEEKLKICSL